MKVYRYMSLTEYNRMLIEEDIVGKSHFAAFTSSTGVCFLPEKVIGKDDDGETLEFTPVEAFGFLYGIVSEDLLVEFEVADGAEEQFKKSYGLYSNPIGWDDISVEELCIPYYNREICNPLRYCVPGNYYGTDMPVWYDCH